MQSLVNTVRTDLYLKQSLANTVQTDPYLVQSLANTVRTESYLVQSLVNTVCIDLLLMQPLANTVRTESYLVQSLVNTVCIALHSHSHWSIQYALMYISCNHWSIQYTLIYTSCHRWPKTMQMDTYLMQSPARIVSKYLGVLRPVNQYGYIRARHILSSHNVKNVYVLKLVYMY